MRPHQRQEVTGVVVNSQMQAPRAMRRRLRQEMYYIHKYGLEEHCERAPSLYGRRLEHLRGVAGYIVFLNPNDRDAKAAFDNLRDASRFQSRDEN